MNEFLTISNITFAIGLMGIIFGVYKYFRDPQIKLDKKDALFDVEIKALRSELANLRDNHVHSLSVKLDETNKNVSSMAIELAKLGTIIEERIPRKTS